MTAIEKKHVGGAGVMAAIIVLLVHVKKHSDKMGFTNAWNASVTRKGSWTASLHHLYAMYTQIFLLKNYPTKDDRATLEYKRAEKNMYGTYQRSTGERHSPEQKTMLREASKQGISVFDYMQATYAK